MNRCNLTIGIVLLTILATLAVIRVEEDYFAEQSISPEVEVLADSLESGYGWRLGLSSSYDLVNDKQKLLARWRCWPCGAEVDIVTPDLGAGPALSMNHTESLRLKQAWEVGYRKLVA